MKNPVSEKDYLEFYKALYAPIESEYGALDGDCLMPIIGFDFGGPMNFCKNRKKGLWVSSELAVRAAQVPSSFGRYEFMAVGPNIENWCLNVLTTLGQMSMTTEFDHHHTIDISPIAKETDTVRAVIMEKYAEIVYRKNQYGIMLVIGLTSDELDKCLAGRKEDVMKNLHAQGIYPKTILNRKSSNNQQHHYSESRGGPPQG